ncbi:TPA: hypothetical protein AB5E44_003220, partial [Vibrio cholerae]
IYKKDTLKVLRKRNGEMAKQLVAQIKLMGVFCYLNSFWGKSLLSYPLVWSCTVSILLSIGSNNRLIGGY